MNFHIVSISLSAILLLITYQSFSLKITEITFNLPLDTQRCQYIEVYNELPVAIDLSNLKVSIEGQIYSLELIDFDLESKGITNSFILEPNSYAIILPEGYKDSSKVFYFPSNALVLKVESYLFTQNKGIDYQNLFSVKLISNSILIDEIRNIILSNHSIVSIFRVNENDFITSETFTPGYDNKDLEFYISPTFHDGKTPITLTLKMNTNASVLPVEILEYHTVYLTKNSSGFYSITINVPFSNGKKIVANFEGKYFATSIINNLFLLSQIYQKIQINEVCFRPSKSWYSYFREGLLITPSPRDKYVEILNISTDIIPLTNFYICYFSNRKTNYFSVTAKSYFSSKLGPVSNRTEILPDEYILMETEDIDEDSLIFLSDDHPFRDGKIISFLESKGVSVLPFSHSNKFNFSASRNTVSLLPNGFYTHFGGKYLSWYETPARYNGFAHPVIYTSSKYLSKDSKFDIFLIQELNQDFVNVSLISEDFIRLKKLNKIGSFFTGTVNLQNENLNIKFSPYKITILYNAFYTNISTEVFITEEKIMEIAGENILLLPTLVTKNTEVIKIHNIPVGSEVKVFNPKHILVYKTITNSRLIEINTKNIISRRGIYRVVIITPRKEIIHKTFAYEY